MGNLDNSIEALIIRELTDANKKYPHFSSLHEGYGVILEEIEETESELENVRKYLGCAWEQIKKDNSATALSQICRVKFAAKALIAEACQVAAMAQKIIDSEDAKHGINYADLKL